MNTTIVDDRQRLLSALGKHWNPTMATMLAAASRTVEQEAFGTEVIDENGTRHLDMAGSYGVFLVGHGNAGVREAVLRTLQTAASVPPGAVHPATAELFEALTAVLPPGLDRFVLGCSGAESSEIALRAVHLARPGRKKILIATGSYHGKTLGALTVLGQPNHRAPFEPLGSELVSVEYGDSDGVRAALAERSVAAVFIEPILGGAHLTVPPTGFLREVAEACRETETLLVADEIQTCLGRTGKMFAVEHERVVPDILLCSKALTGGFIPVAVCALSSEVVTAAQQHPLWDPSLLAGTGNTSALSVAAASAAIREVVNGKLAERAATLGPRLLNGLAEAARRHPKHLVEAQGIGLMTGLRTRNPAVELLISMGMAARGVHTGHSLNEKIHHPVLRFYPPLTATTDEIDRTLEALEDTLVWLDRRSRLFTAALTWLLRRQHRLPPRLVLQLSRSNIRADW